MAVTDGQGKSSGGVQGHHGQLQAVLVYSRGADVDEEIQHMLPVADNSIRAAVVGLERGPCESTQT